MGWIMSYDTIEPADGETTAHRGLGHVSLGFALVPFQQKIREVIASNNAIKAAKLRIRKSMLCV